MKKSIYYIFILIAVLMISMFSGCSNKQKYENNLLDKDVVKSSYNVLVDYLQKEKEEGTVSKECNHIRIIDTYVYYVNSNMTDETFKNIDYIIDYSMTIVRESEKEALYGSNMRRSIVVYKNGAMKCCRNAIELFGSDNFSKFTYMREEIIPNFTIEWCGCAYNIVLEI